MSKNIIIFSLLFFLTLQSEILAKASDYPDPVSNPMSALMHSGDWVPAITHNIDFFKLSKIPSEHAIISYVSYAWGRKTKSGMRTGITRMIILDWSIPEVKDIRSLSVLFQGNNLHKISALYITCWDV